MDLQENIPLAPFTTLNVGGPARFFCIAESEDDLQRAFRFASANKLEVFVLGGGSNILISDNGFPGLVVQIALSGTEFREDSSGKVRLTAAAGEDWDRLVAETVARGLAGFECLSGIPGSVGGTPVQNVGAYGQEVSGTIDTVRCFDRTRNEFVVLNNDECGFSYRRSIFNSSEQDCYVVVSVDYLLRAGGTPNVTYRDLAETFAGRDPSLSETRDAVLRIRSSKSMVIDERDPNSKSAGSFFKNPIVPADRVLSIATAAGVDNAPHFPAGKGLVKVPAAWLIERAGFAKGSRDGRVGISTNHSLAIVNLGGATADDILRFKQAIQDAVYEKFRINLVPEPVFVGF